jgi:hypothetical protein
MNNDAAFVQGYIDRGELIPAGVYDCPKVSIPTGYVTRAEAVGREPDMPGGWFSLAEPPGARLRVNGHDYGVLGHVRQVVRDGQEPGLDIRNVSGPQLAEDE